MQSEDLASAFQKQLVRMRRFFWFSGTALLLIGLVLVAIALGVFLTQGSQVRVTATVLSEHCHPQQDLATGAEETRCDASVRFTARSGQVIRTTVTDALPYEFSHRQGLPTTIQLRYDPSNPADPFKQSNYMSASEFAVTLTFGACSTAAGIVALAGAERFAQNSVRRRQPGFTNF
jgi:hypothetical protein